MPESNNQKFNHLKVHTQYSICEGAIKIENLKEFCKSRKVISVGLSDTSNLCGALEFAENISKVGTQPIIGTQIYFSFVRLRNHCSWIHLARCNKSHFSSYCRL